MVFLNMIIGLGPFLIWSIGIVIIIFIEGIFLSRYLDNVWFNKKILRVVAISNLITLILGLINVLNFIWEKTFALLTLNINIEQSQQPYFRGGIEIFVTFCVSFIVESLINTFFLKTDYKIRRLEIGTLFSNLITYIIITGLIIGFI